jgi:hypothetical protein
MPSLIYLLHAAQLCFWYKVSTGNLIAGQRHA